MIKIAICDDDSLAIENLQQLVTKYQEEVNHGLEISIFHSSGELLEKIKQGTVYDVYLLDVVMPEVNGISIGKFICENQKEAKVIFCSTTKEFAVDAFDVRAFYYLLKPIDEEKLFSVLNMVIEAVAVKENQPVYIIVDTQDGTQAIDSSQIVSCTLENRRLVYKLFGSNCSVYSKMLRMQFSQCIEHLIQIDNFVQCNSYSVVNIGMISKFESDKLTMKNGEEMAVSRNCKADIKTAYFKYYFEFSGGGRSH